VNQVTFGGGNALGILLLATQLPGHRNVGSRYMKLVDLLSGKTVRRPVFRHGDGSHGLSP
jgi:hypothetical protein